MGIIRLLLALSVIAAHYGNILGLNFVGGQIAVQSFFIISGFYMSLILNEKYNKIDNSYRLFITNRFMRLYPIYWTVLLITVLCCVAVALISKGNTVPKFDSYLSVKPNLLSFGYLIITNIILFGQDLVLFLGINPGTGVLYFTENFWNTSPPLHSFLFIPQAWTLALELTFYLMAPFIVKRGLKFIVILIILSFALRMIIYNYFQLQNDPWTYRFFPTEIMFFLLGNVSYRIYLLLKGRQISNTLNWSVLILVILFTSFYSYLPSTKISWFPFSIKESVHFSMIIAAIPLIFNFRKKSSIDIKIGELSYPIYISHLLVGTILEVIGSRYSAFSFLKTGSFIAFITIIVSYSLNRVIADPIEKYRQSRLLLKSN